MIYLASIASGALQIQLEIVKHNHFIPMVSLMSDGHD